MLLMSNFDIDDLIMLQQVVHGAIIEKKKKIV
jgi:hypothetical protein